MGKEVVSVDEATSFQDYFCFRLTSILACDIRSRSPPSCRNSFSNVFNCLASKKEVILIKPIITLADTSGSELQMNSDFW